MKRCGVTERPKAIIASPMGIIKRMGTTALLLAAVGNALLFAGLVPLWQGPDEAAHFSYIQFIAEERAMPVYHLPYQLYRTDLQEDIRASRARLEADALSFHPGTVQSFLYGTPPPPAAGNRHAAHGDFRNNALSYGPLYYSYGAAAYLLCYSADVETRVYAVRIATALLMIPFAWFVYRFGRLLLGNRRKGLAFAAFVTLQPMVAHIFAIVNNDAMLVTCAAGSFWLMASYLSRGDIRHAAGAGIFAGAAAVAKSHGVFVIAALPLFPLMRFAVTRRMPWRAAAYSIGAALLTAGPWFAFSFHQYGSLFGVGGGATGTGPPSVGAVFTPLFFRWPLTLFVSFFGNFGTLDTPLPARTALVIWYLHIAAFVAVVLAAGTVMARRSLRGGRGLFILCVTLVAGFDLMLALFFYGGMMDGGQGRYYFTVWPLMAAALFYALNIFLPRRMNRPFMGILVLAMALLSICAAFHVVLPRYYL